MKPVEEFMRMAIEAGFESAKNGNPGIGAVIVHGNDVVSIGYETLKTDYDPVNGHAEIDAIRNACKKLQQNYLEDCVLYSTHEPCPMCAAASVWAKLDTIIYGIPKDDIIQRLEKRADKSEPWRHIDIKCQEIVDRGMPKIKLIPGFLREECLKLYDAKEKRIR